jgi:hypothetical protein
MGILDELLAKSVVRQPDAAAREASVRRWRVGFTDFMVFTGFFLYVPVANRRNLAVWVLRNGKRYRVQANSFIGVC